MKFLAAVQKYLTLMGLGLLAGVIGVGLLGIRALQWYAAPAISGALCTCDEGVRWGAEHVFRTQLIAGGVGAVLMVVVGAMVTSWARGRAQRKAAARAQAPSQSRGP